MKIASKLEVLRLELLALLRDDFQKSGDAVEYLVKYADSCLMLTRIKDLAQKLAPRLIEIRRHIHAHPELSGQEHQTAAYVAGVLSSCGIHVQEAVGRTG